jgi:hypothetical protein
MLLPLCLLVLLPCVASAADPYELFAAETVVADEGSETRNAALSGLLAEVLVRISGNPAISAQPAAREVLSAAPSLVEQYRYRSAERNGELQRFLWAHFDQSAVERMMRERNLPVWVQRPRVLMWVATERGGQRDLLNLEGLPAERMATQERAQQRGMPLQLPLMDLEDQTQLTAADVWSDYQAAVEQASARYPHDVVITGRLRAQGSDKWSGVWTLYDRDASQTFQSPPQPLAAALTFAVDQTQNLLAARHAPMPVTGPGRGTLVRFSEVRDLPGYGRLVGILAGLDPLNEVALRGVDRDSFTFELRLRGNEQDMLRSLDASGQLVAEPAAGEFARPAVRELAPLDGTATGVPAPEADYRYRLLN